jgi:3-isopropylmalate/(R)-2-methylmalate dehydratase small subunit
MKPFTVLDGLVAPLDRPNVDTDAIIPKQFLKSILRSGFGPNLFDEWRYMDVGQPGMDNSGRPLNPNFVLNQERYRGAQVLLSRENFGCGSSREHAPWAIEDYGFRAIVGPSFADIFFNNCFKNGMLPVVLPESEVRKCMQEANAAKEIEIDLPNQVVILSTGEKIKFDVDPFRKNCLIEGLDDIGLTMKKEAAIAAFEKKRDTEFSFLKGIELAKV